MNISKNSPPSTRCKIIEEAEKLFSKYNYNAVSLNDIAKKIKITKAALYYHFVSKEELFMETLTKSHKGISEKISEIMATDLELEKKFKKILTTILDIKINQKYLTNLSVQKFSKEDKNISKIVCNFKDEIISQVEPLMEEIIKKYKYPPNTDPKVLAFFLFAVLKGYSVQKACGDCEDWNVEKISNELITIIFRK